MTKPEIVYANHPPHDGRAWDNQCARCGSSMHWIDCDNCGGEGLSGHDCGEDTCCCAEPEDNEECDWCFGEGGHFECSSSAEWCEAHPNEGREHVPARYSTEWFTFDPPKSPGVRP